MCLLGIAVFEGDASLKWLLLQSKLKSGICITKKETATKIYQSLHHNTVLKKVVLTLFKIPV